MILKAYIIIFLAMSGITSIAQEVRIDQEVKMLALGDSYTIGQSVGMEGRWPHQLLDKLRFMGFTGMNPDYIATTGWTTQDLIRRMSSMPEQGLSYNLVSLLIGVNNQYQGIPIESYEPDLRQIIDLALGVLKQDTSRLLILSIPDYAYTPFGSGAERISREIDDYNEIKRRVADEYKLTFIDITPISREGLDNASLVASDGLHPSEKQYKLWVEAILPRLSIEGNLINDDPQQLENDLVSVYPNPAGSFVQIDSLKKISRISIINSTGSVVSNHQISTFSVRLDLSHLEPGLYTLWINHLKSDALTLRKISLQ